MGHPHRADALVLFGISGDLAHKKLFPALWALHERGRLDVPVVGVALSDWDDEELRRRARSALEDHGVRPGEDDFAAFAARLRYVQGDYSDPGLYGRIRDDSGTGKNAAGWSLGTFWDIFRDTTFYALADELKNDPNAGFRPSGSAGLTKTFTAPADVNGQRIRGAHVGFVYKF